MGVSVPKHYTVDVDTQVGGSLTLNGLPKTYQLNVNVERLPKIQIGVDPVTINPVTVHLAIDKIPDTRVHFPADFSVGFSLLGMELLCVRLCGEAQMINEPYRPNPCEVCDPPLERQVVTVETDLKAGGR